MPASPQRQGDPARGRIALLNENYIGCGVPDSLLQRLNPFRPTPLAGRAEHNRDLPFFLTRYHNSDGIAVVTANCLGCHAAYLRGELVVGLGNISVDFGIDPRRHLALLSAFASDGEARELDLLRSRIDALYPNILMKSEGPNPADHIAAILFAHRDPKTLAWSGEPRMPVPEHAPPPVDVPPWWMMKKKNAMFYTAAGRGDHARIMMTASALCTDSVAQAAAIDAYFPDVRAYIESLEPPAFPGVIDAEAASRGEEIFTARCARCHGTYHSDPQRETYPNLVVALDVVGTDPTLAVGAGQFSQRFVDWFNRSYYGAIAKLEPQPGYIAPPLDGVWATAPYFHNGSVPTLSGVLQSKARPKRWARASRASRSYQLNDPGWPHVTTDAEPADEALRQRVYDTSRKGHTASGHTFADSLTPSQRGDLLAYLKTL